MYGYAVNNQPLVCVGVLCHRYKRQRLSVSPGVVTLQCDGAWLLNMYSAMCGPWCSDLSATEGYQRDNFLHWMVYWQRFMVGRCRLTLSNPR